MRNLSKGKWVFDTNLLIYALDSNSPYYSATCELFSLVENNFIRPVVAIQNIIEAENILINIYKLDVEDVIGKIENMLQSCNMQIISPDITTYESFHKLIKEKGKKADIFDYFLAATVIDNNIFRILTANDKDFENIRQIEAVNPYSGK